MCHMLTVDHIVLSATHPCVYPLMLLTVGGWFHYDGFLHTEMVCLSTWALTGPDVELTLLVYPHPDPLTPILIIRHPLSFSSIYYDPYHPLVQFTCLQSLSQPLSRSSFVFLLVWDPLLYTPYIHPIIIFFSFLPAKQMHQNYVHNPKCVLAIKNMQRTVCVRFGMVYFVELDLTNFEWQKINNTRKYLQELP